MGDGPDQMNIEIIGVVADSLCRAAEGVRRQVFIPTGARQRGGLCGRDGVSDPHNVIRTR